MTTRNSLSASIMQRENLSTMVEEYIKDNILRGVYKGGDHLLETDIAETLGISRGPVREAIKAVEQTGIITVEPRRGAYVTTFDRESINEVFEIRLLIETSILEDLITQNKLEAPDFDDLDRIVEEMVEIAGGQSDPDEALLAINKKDIEFHQYIWRKSRSKRKEKILDDYFFQLRIAMLHDTKMTQDLMKTATDHYAILQCLRAGDIKNCKQSLIDHIICDFPH
ncbi:MAG: GntR family transcriptional regulator [Oscillospiraceae bacterium]|nr:GntR family transcriptional regulator [Oscillospiraceae bacterium]